MIPANFDIDHVLTKEEPDFEYSRDFFYYFLHHIIEKNASIIEEKERFAGRNFIEMCSKDLQNIIRNYNKHTDYLLKHKIIKRSPYKVKKNCFKYRLTIKYQRQRLIYKNLSDPDIIEKIRKLNGDEIPNKIRKKYNFLLNHLNFDKIEIDYEKAIYHTNKAFSVTNLYRKYQRNIVNINHIHNGIRRIYYNERTDGRIHTPITSLSSYLRQYLTYNGEYLAEVDLSNSVMYFLYIALLSPAEIVRLPILTNPSILVKSSKIVDSVELGNFGGKVLEGTIYEQFFDDFKNEFNNNYFNKACWDILGEEYTGKEYQLRKIVKKKILATIFSKRKDYKTEREIFSKYYPTINDFLRRLKWTNHKRLSHFLFQMEAHYMLGITARKYNREKRGKELLLTLHDCLITTENNIEQLRGHLISTFIEHLKIPPQAKIKYWNPESKIAEVRSYIDKLTSFIKKHLREDEINTLIKHLSKGKEKVQYTV